MRIRILNILLFCFSIVAIGQDIHFSQFNEIPLNLNPALAGNSESTKRAGLIYRNQWNSVTTPFQSSGVFADMKLSPPLLKGDHLGIGIMFLNDQSGSGGLTENHLILSSNYQKFLDPKQVWLLTAGPQIGFFQKGYDPSSLNFETDFAYESASFVSNGSFQNLNKTSIVKFELGLGATITYFNKKGYPTIAGISLSHLTTPDLSLLGYSDPLKMKSVAHASTVKPLTENIRIRPSLLFMNQNNASEIVLGAQVIYSLGRSLIEDTELKGGLYYRVEDAIFFTFGINHDNWGINLGYDYTVSSLSEAAKNVNAFEIAITIKNKLFKSQSKRFILPGNRLL